MSYNPVIGAVFLVYIVAYLFVALFILYGLASVIVKR
jgi:hypothetical protein